jgi:hypothetical protein
VTTKPQFGPTRSSGTPPPSALINVILVAVSLTGILLASWIQKSRISTMN